MTRSRPQDDGLRNGKTDALGGGHVERKADPAHLLDRQRARAGALQTNTTGTRARIAFV